MDRFGFGMMEKYTNLPFRWWTVADFMKNEMGLCFFVRLVNLARPEKAETWDVLITWFNTKVWIMFEVRIFHQLGFVYIRWYCLIFCSMVNHHFKPPFGWCFPKHFFQQIRAILLMEEIRNNHLTCMKPCKYWDIYHINRCRISSINCILALKDQPFWPQGPWSSVAIQQPPWNQRPPSAGGCFFPERWRACGFLF